MPTINGHGRWWVELVIFWWACGEATVVPIMPDAIVVPLTLARPQSWWRLSLAAMLGSTAGGAVSYWLGRRSQSIASIEQLPLVRPAMVAATDRWLLRDGSRGAVRQPLTGVPFKVFARIAGARGLPLGRFLAWAVTARGARFLVASYGAALSARRRGPFTPRQLTGLAVFWWVVFAVGLWRLVAYWGQASSEQTSREV